MSGTAVSRDEVELLDLQSTLERISQLPQATIAKIEGFARGGGHEFALACDMRFAARGKARFMQMEVGMGILPCGGGASRMARQVGLGRALEIILGAQDFDADQAEAYGTINKAFDPEEIGPFVEALAKRIALFPAESIEACKRAVYASIDMPIDQALKEEAYWLLPGHEQDPGPEALPDRGRTGPPVRHGEPTQLGRPRRRRPGDPVDQREGAHHEGNDPKRVRRRCRVRSHRGPPPPWPPPATSSSRSPRRASTRSTP